MLGRQRMSPSRRMCAMACAHASGGAQMVLEGLPATLHISASSPVMTEKRLPALGVPSGPVAPRGSRNGDWPLLDDEGAAGAAWLIFDDELAAKVAEVSRTKTADAAMTKCTFTGDSFLGVEGTPA